MAERWYVRFEGDIRDNEFTVLGHTAADALRSATREAHSAPPSSARCGMAPSTIAIVDPAVRRAERRLGAICLPGLLLISCPNGGREVFDDHLPGPGVLQHPRRQLVNGMGRGPRAALIGPVLPQPPADPVSKKGALRILRCDHTCLGESPPRSEACACVLPAKLGDEGPKL